MFQVSPISQRPEAEYVIASVDYDEYGRATAHAEAELPDGTYEAEVIVEQIHPISFLLESR